MSTPSPKTSLDWFLGIWQQAKTLNFTPIEWNIKECDWINEKDTENAARLYGIDSETYRAEFLGEIPERRGLVWNNQYIDGRVPDKPCALVDPRDTNRYPPPAPHKQTHWTIGLDWGYTHPTVITAWEKQCEIVYLRDCRIRREESFTEIRQEIMNDYPQVPVYADAASPGEIHDLRAMGQFVTPVIFSKDKAELINHGLIKIPDPKIDKRYYTFVQQMKHYSYDEKTEKPTKRNDDCVDSMLCGMMGYMRDNRGLFTIVGARRPS
jgi:hypothetical protein